VTHDEARAQIAFLFEARHEAVKREALLEHLKTCEPCRAVYDASAATMRRVLGNPDEMTSEELWLFEPPLPPAKVVPLFRAAPAIGFALAASLAVFVIYAASSSNRSDDGFSPRGQPQVPAEASSIRALCSRDGEMKASCGPGDAVLFAATPRGGPTHVKISVVGGEVVGEGDLVEGGLPWTTMWQPGMKLQAELSACAGCKVEATLVFAP
jgi:hypothetical protein